MAVPRSEKVEQGAAILSPGKAGVESSMANDAARILAEALALAPEERALLAGELLASLDPDVAGVQHREAEWIADIERRARAAIAGSPAVSWPEARARILDRLSKS
jgi:Putative addiction module component